MSKRRPIHSQMNYNSRFGENQKTTEKGTRPTAERTSVKEIFTLMLLHVCKKSIFFDTNIKVALYLLTLFLVSLIADFLPLPKVYFARSDNFFNIYFVKFAWGWNLLLLLPFVTLTSLTLCCGNIKTTAKEHLPRILIATFFWFFWTKLFTIIENNYGKCKVTKGDQYNTKQSCLQYGYFWNGFDISGHSFILIYGSLVLIEEARVILGWENIKEYLRNEEHNRNIRATHSTNVLRNLSEHELIGLKIFYEKFTVYIRGLFIAMTAYQILWDVMLVSTILYYHIMVEKFIAGAIAILTWFFTYRFWYRLPNVLPRSPGDGVFKYNKEKTNNAQLQNEIRRKASFNKPDNVPKFMGMPLYKTNDGSSTSATSEEISTSSNIR